MGNCDGLNENLMYSRLMKNKVSCHLLRKIGQLSLIEWNFGFEFRIHLGTPIKYHINDVRSLFVFI
jgi:hypothetical protein